MVKYLDRYENVKKADGVKTESVHRECIEEKEKELLRKAESVKDIKEYLARIHDVKLGDENQQGQDGGQ